MTIGAAIAAGPRPISLSEAATLDDASLAGVLFAAGAAPSHVSSALFPFILQAALRLSPLAAQRPGPRLQANLQRLGLAEAETRRLIAAAADHPGGG